MPRGPYQGTFQPSVRPTIVTAPDAMVLINGETDIAGCPSCRRRFDWNRYVTSIQVDLSVESVPGSATVSMSIPRHSIDDFYFDGQPIICPMMEIEIYAKGHYLVEGVPQYYPIFWGMITEVGDSYSGGEHSVSIHCADILKWWELSKMNINPSYTGAKGQEGTSIFGNVFFGRNPYDVIWTLAMQSFGDVVVGSGSLVSSTREQGGQKKVFTAAMGEMMTYWNARFSHIRSNLLLYGVNGNVVRGDQLDSAWRSGQYGKDRFASLAVNVGGGGKDAGQMYFDPTDEKVVAFRTQFNQAGQVNFWQSEFQTKLELANAAKEAIGFEFYMDVTGDIVFKPPFFNLDTLANKPVSWIQDIDVIDWDFSESEAEVITQLQLQGAWGGPVDYGMPAECTPFTSVTDYHLLRKYGWRTHTYNSEFMGDPNLMFYHGIDILDRINSKRHRGTVNIPLRPELRLGFPVYVAPKDQIWYVQGISHNIQFGGRAQTTLTLTAKRQKFIAPQGIGSMSTTCEVKAEVNKAGPDKKAKKSPSPPSPKRSFKYSSRQLSKFGKFQIKIGDAAQLPPDVDAATKAGGKSPYDPLILRHPKTGRIVGYPNVVLAYTRPFLGITLDDIGKKTGIRTNPQKDQKLNQNIKANMERLSKELKAENQDRLRIKHLTNRYQYGMNSAGVYVYLHDKDAVVGEVVMANGQNITTDPQTVTTTDKDGKTVDVAPFPKSTAMIRPVSDERGFEVIGHFRYGRGVALRDGQLVLNDGKNNGKADQALQVALSGDMFAMLHAQSSGLTTITSAYSNPVAMLTSLKPDTGELQSAGYVNPTTRKPEFIPTGDNFVAAAPLGSAEQKGVPASVEATQLSRAVTLAEMAVIDGQGADSSKDDTCMCLLGRADLAFMNFGNQVKVLKQGAMPDASTLYDTNLSNVDLGSPVLASTTLKSPEEVASKVDAFLFDLYSQLEGPHGEYEAELRGDLTTTPGEFDQLVNGRPGDNPVSEMRPPFGALGRSALGDPAATAALGHTAVDNMKKNWSDFGTKLQNNMRRTQLTGEIARDQAAIKRFQQELEKLKIAKASSTVLVGIPGVDTQIEQLQRDIAERQRDLDKERAELAHIPATP